MGQGAGRARRPAWGRSHSDTWVRLHGLLGHGQQLGRGRVQVDLLALVDQTIEPTTA